MSTDVCWKVGRDVGTNPKSLILGRLGARNEGIVNLLYIYYGMTGEDVTWTAIWHCGVTSP